MKKPNVRSEESVERCICFMCLLWKTMS